jgi:AcrR family transcriptional regulator
LSAEPHTITLTRTLTGAQAERRRALVTAATELGREGGYAAVTMHDVSVRAGVGRATVYRYFSSKDHLLAAVSAQVAAEISDDIRSRPPRHAKAADRVAAVFDRVIDRAMSEFQLSAALVQASVSCDAGVWDSEPGPATSCPPTSTP